MSWQPYVMIAFAVLVLGALVGLSALVGFDGAFVLGAGIGLGASLLLLAFSQVTTRLGLGSKGTSAMLGHVVGGFALRLTVLVVGFVLMVLTGVANPAAFALAFLAGVLLMLGWQVYGVARDIQRRAATA